MPTGLGTVSSLVISGQVILVQWQGWKAHCGELKRDERVILDNFLAKFKWEVEERKSWEYGGGGLERISLF